MNLPPVNVDTRDVENTDSDISITLPPVNVDKRAVAFYVASKDDPSVDKRAVAFYVAPKEGDDANLDKRAVAFYVAPEEGANVDDTDVANNQDFFIPPGQKRSIPTYFNTPDKSDFYLPPIIHTSPDEANVDKRAVAFYVAPKEGDDANLDKRAVAFYVAPKEGTNADGVNTEEDFYIPPPPVTGPHGQKRSIPIYYFNPPEKRESTDGKSRASK